MVLESLSDDTELWDLVLERDITIPEHDGCASSSWFTNLPETEVFTLSRETFLYFNVLASRTLIKVVCNLSTLSSCSLFCTSVFLFFVLRFLILGLHAFNFGNLDLGL